MSSLQYGSQPGAGTALSDTYYYSQYVRLPHGITKLSGQGGWTKDSNWAVDRDDWRGQIERAFDNVEHVLQTAGLSGWDDVYFMRSYLTNTDEHYPFFIETMRKRIGHRIIYTALTVARLGHPDMIVEIEVEAYRK